MLASSDPDQQSAEFAMVGKLLAEMVDDECLGLLIPTHNQLLPWEPEFAKALVSDDPLSALCSELVPVVRVDEDDPRIQAAVAEARKKFLLFEEAFRNGNW